MTKSSRLFVAVKITPTRGLRKVLSRLEVMGRAVKPVAAENLHITLQFLGETDLAFAPQIAGAVEEAVGEKRAFEMSLVGLGAFPHVRRPSVVWVGASDAQTLVEIAASLQCRLEPLGFKPERRKFAPHITLARVRSKPPGELAVLLEAEQSTDFGSVPVMSIQLFQSELRPDGPRYTVVSTIELTAG